MLIDQGLQCTYLNHDVASLGMRHFEPILAMIWMHVSRLTRVISKEGNVFYSTEPEDVLVVLSRLSNDIDPLQILRWAEEDEEVRDIEKGCTESLLRSTYKSMEEKLVSYGRLSFSFLEFALKVLRLDIDSYQNIYDFFADSKDPSRISVIHSSNKLSVVLHEDMIKDRLSRTITDCVLSDLPIYLRTHFERHLRCWIDNAFLANEMDLDREYIVKGDAIYPVDYQSTGVIETNKKWGDGLQQFLEMKHQLPRSSLSLITNFLSNIDYFDRYESIFGVSGTLGNVAEKEFMSDTFSVEFATIPPSNRRKLFELDGMILDKDISLADAVSEKVESAVASKRAVLVICEDISNAKNIFRYISGWSKVGKPILYLQKIDGARINKELKPEDVVITTNLGARGTDFVTDAIVNQNGGLCVLVTFIPLNDRVEKQAFGRTGRRGVTGSLSDYRQEDSNSRVGTTVRNGRRSDTFARFPLKVID